jgi:hypothetical protein
MNGRSYIWQVLAKGSYSSSQLEALHQIQWRILECSKRVWSAVRHVLCDDSPEVRLLEFLLLFADGCGWRNFEVVDCILSFETHCFSESSINRKDLFTHDVGQGHLPEEMEEIDGLDTKDLLSYSFRAIHESRYGKQPEHGIFGLF